MAQKVNQPAPAPMIITITLPDEDKLLRTGQILIQQGTLAKLNQFEYADLHDIMTAIENNAAALMQIVANPPDLTPAPPRPQAAATPQQSEGEGDPAQPEGSTAQDEESEAQEAADQATGTSESSPAAESVQADQLHLF